jgi:hypothetical protein
MDASAPARPPADAAGQPSAARVVVGVVVAVGLLLAVGVTVAKAVSTSSARVSASTSSGGLLSAGTIVIDRAEGSTSIILDADNLYPGRVVVGCVELEYLGSVPAEIRLHGDRGAGTGLDRWVDVRFDVLDVDTCPAADVADGASVDIESTDESSTELFRGRLSSLWTDHVSFATGVVVDPSVAPGDRLVLRTTAVVVDDNRAAGLTTDFVLTVEGRPR